MRRFVPILVAVLSVSAFAADTTVQGYLLDVSCSARNAGKPGFAAGHSITCLRMPSCADSGYGVLTEDKHFIRFDAAGNEKAKKFIGDITKDSGIHIAVSGALDGDTITVTNLRLLDDTPALQQGQSVAPQSPELPQKQLPFIVKGAWASASDSVTPLPEGGVIANSVYTNQYFGMSYPFSSDWYEKTQGPPPSDNGYYVLAQIRPSDRFQGSTKGLILIGAQDLFFSLIGGGNALEFIHSTRDILKPEYKVERPPTEVRIANRSFVRFDYVAPAIDLHWYTLATEIRCHMVQFIFTSRDTKLLENLIQELNNIQLPAEAGATSGTGGGDSPVCIKDYAAGDHVTSKVDPVFGERKFNPVPVRIIIGKDGKVKHIHFISAFPDQAKAITDAVRQWTFRPYLRNGQPVEVETGIMFGSSPPRTPPATSAARPAAKPAN